MFHEKSEKLNFSSSITSLNIALNLFQLHMSITVIQTIILQLAEARKGFKEVQPLCDQY